MFQPEYKRHLLNFEKLRNTIEKDMLQVGSKNDWDRKSDVRIRTISAFHNLLISFEFGLIFVLKDLSKIEWIQSFYKKMDDESAIHTHHIFNSMLINGYFYSLTGVIENFFRSMVRETYPGNKAAKEFNRVWSALFEHIAYENDEHVNLMDLLTTLRNRIHNNGIHFDRKSEDKVIKYKGINYVFNHGETQPYLTYKNMLMLTEDVYQLVKKIIEEGKINSIPHIKDTTAGY